MIVRAAKGYTSALEMKVVTWLLLAETVVVDFPLFGCRRADVRIKTLVVLVYEDVAWYGGWWQVLGRVETVDFSMR